MMKHIKNWYFKVQEPRLQRLLYLGFYIMIIITGVGSFFDTTGHLYQFGGDELVFSLAGFFTFGGVVGAISVIPGTWWLERVGLLSVGLGMLARGIVINGLGISWVGGMLFYSTIFLLVIRFVQIRKDDLAPISE